MTAINHNSNREDARRRFFNDRAENWADSWQTEPPTDGKPSIDERFAALFAEVDIPADGTVLDVGCGNGVLVPRILPRLSGRGHLIELDYAEAMIEVNRRRHNDPRISFRAEDIMRTNLPDAYVELAMCFCCFPHFDDKPAALRLLARLLKPGGCLAVAHFDSSADLNRFHARQNDVDRDVIPDSDTMRAWMVGVGLTPEQFRDEPGLYLLTARKHCA